MPHRTFPVLSNVEKSAIFLPFAKIFLPTHRKGTGLAMGVPADSALRVDLFLEAEGCEASQLVKAGGVGDERPYRRRRLGEIPFLAIAVGCFHSITSQSSWKFCSGSHPYREVIRGPGHAFAC